MLRASKNVFLNFLSDHKSIDAGKQLRYAEHHYKYLHEKLGRKNENSSNGYNIKKHKKRPTYASRYTPQGIKLVLITYI
jgi:hypothetical protein